MNDDLTARLPTTRWSAVQRAGSDPAALAELLSQYRPALRAYLIRTRRADSHDADDFVQGFLCSKFIEVHEHDYAGAGLTAEPEEKPRQPAGQNLAAKADPARGRFRSFVLRSLERYVADERRKQAAHRRGGGKGRRASSEALENVSADESSASQQFDAEWARQVLFLAVERTRQECETGGRDDLWAVLHGRLIAPTLESASPLDYEELVRRCGFKSPTQASNALITAKRMVQRHLRAIVSDYIAREPPLGHPPAACGSAGTPGNDPDSPRIEDEIRDLYAILALAGAGS